MSFSKTHPACHRWDSERDNQVFILKFMS